jgi:hypothetical protein
MQLYLKFALAVWPTIQRGSHRARSSESRMPEADGTDGQAGRVARQHFGANAGETTGFDVSLILVASTRVPPVS